MELLGKKINLKVAIPVAIGIALLIYWNRSMLSPVKKPLDADAGVRDQDTVNSDASIIDRALSKLKNGTVKVNETPQEVKDRV